MNKAKLFALGVAGISSYALLAEASQQKPHDANIMQLKMSQDDKNRLLYLQSLLVNRYQGKNFSDWQEENSYPEYDKLSITAILNERDTILLENGYGLGTLTWNFTGKENDFHEKLTPNYLKTHFQSRIDDVLNDNFSPSQKNKK